MPPSRELVDFVTVFYLFETDDASLDELERADVAQLRFNLDGSGKLVMPGWPDRELPKIALLGPRMVASRVVATGPARVFGCGLTPGGWAMITQLDASAHADTVQDAELVIKGYVHGLFAQFCEMQQIEEMVALFEANHRSVAAHFKPAPLAFIQLVDRWLEDSLNPHVADLVDASGYGQRTVERMVKKLYGASPKLLARKYRALRAANAIATGNGAWQDYAMELYYDHSHCIRDIKTFVGVTPASLRDHQHQLLDLTFGRRQLSGIIAPLAAES